MDTITDGDGVDRRERENFIVTSNIKRVIKYKTLESVDDIVMDSFNLLLLCFCKIPKHKEIENCDCPKESFFPFYIAVEGDGTQYIIHPGDRDKMAKLLNPPQTGVDALVHELRYNVDIVHEVDEVKNDFNKRTRS